MITNQILQGCIDEIKSITRMEFCVFDPEGKCLALTGGTEPDAKMIREFANSAAESQVIGNLHLLKVFDEGEPLYILSASGEGENVYMVGRMTVSQLQAISVAYKDRFDRNNFFQNLILDNLLLVDIYNRAKRLRIENSQKRVVYLIEVKADADGIATELLRGMYTAQSGDAVTSVDENTVILVKAVSEKMLVKKETSPVEGEDKTGLDPLREIAETVVALLNTEALLAARVSYGTVVSELKDVSKSYKEAKMAMEVGKIFYADRSVIPYTALGIGRLIYQLPVSLCEIFIKEIFGDGIPAELDEETRNTLKKFFENNLNVSETSRQLFVHRNTLVYRIDKVQKVTGLDLRRFDDALTFQIAMMVESYLKYVEGRDLNY